MSSADIAIVRQALASAPKDYELSGQQELSPLAVRAEIDGSGAGSAFLPALQLIGPSGDVLWTAVTATTVAAGGSADVSWFPRVKQPAAAPTSATYAQTVVVVATTTSLIAEWHLTEGSSPYADTSGFAPADPATQTRQAGVVAMTQAFTPGPLAGTQAADAVAFNYDGDALTSTGDSLGDNVASPVRYSFFGVLPFSVIAWVRPFASVNAHDGPVVGTIHVTGFGGPGAHDDGWRLNVTAPGRIPQFQRATNVLLAGSYDTAAGPALAAGTWAMLAGTYDGANLRLYVDGALAATTASAGGITALAGQAQIGVGAHKLGDYSTWYYGAAGEVTIWGAALSAATIAQLYTAGTT